MGMEEFHPPCFNPSSRCHRCENMEEKITEKITSRRGLHISSRLANDGLFTDASAHVIHIYKTQQLNTQIIEALSYQENISFDNLFGNVSVCYWLKANAEPVVAKHVTNITNTPSSHQMMK